MKNLLDQALDFNNLVVAWETVEENRGIAGVDNISVKRWRRNWEERIHNLTIDVYKGQYQAKALRIRKIPKKRFRERRVLQIPTVTDRVLQRAVLQILYPIYEPLFLNCSFGYRPGVGLKDAVQKILDMREKYPWVLDADIDDFFGNLDHILLIRFLTDDLPDDSLFPLFHQWLQKMNYQQDGMKGVPIGSPISPLFANLYLHRMDANILELGYQLVRYADDFCIFLKTQKQAEKAFCDCQSILKTLKLRYEPTKTQITKFEQGFNFIGVSFKGDHYEYICQQKKIVVEGNEVDSLFNDYGPDY